MVAASLQEPLTGCFRSPTLDQARSQSNDFRDMRRGLTEISSPEEDVDQRGSFQALEEPWTGVSFPSNEIQNPEFEDSISGLQLKRTASKVLESYRGRVLSICEDTAYVELKNIDGELFSGEYSATKLRKLDISQHDYFNCKTIANGDEVSISIEKVLPIPLSDEAIREIGDQISSELMGLE